jgi:putative transposase
MSYRKGSHTVYELHYHFVFVTKYRKPALRGEIGAKLRTLVREICKAEDAEILKGHIRPDHVHLMLSLPPHRSPSQIMQAIKGKTSHHLMMEYRALNREFWGRHLWARGYFACTTGNVTDEAIKPTFRTSRGALRRITAPLSVSYR